MPTRYFAFKQLLPIMFLGTGVLVQMVCIAAFLNARLDWLLATLTFFVTTGTYLLNRVVDAEDRVNNAERWEFFNGSRLRSWFWTGASILLLGAPPVAALVRGQSLVALCFLILGIVGAAYSIQVLPSFAAKRVRWISIKDVPIVKTLIVCAIWSGTGLVLTVTANRIPFSRFDIWTVFLAFFVSTMNSTITSDARDVAGDRERGLLTIPLMLGPKGTLWTLSVFNVGTVAWFTWLGAQNALSLPLAFACGLNVVWAGLTSIPQYVAPSRLSKTSMELLVDSHLVAGPLFVGALWFLNP